MAAFADLVKSASLSLGSQGQAVQQLQNALAQLGYPLKGTGYFGGATDTAVVDFQKRQGLGSDGVVGPQTAAALDRAIAARAGAPAPTPAAAVSDPVGRPLWLTEAVKWINTKEGPGDADNPQILEWAREEGGSIAHDYTHDSIPWCALFANMVLVKVGLKGTGTLWALDFATWGVPLAGPAVGAFAPMRREGGGHIAIVVGRDQHGNLMCIGGNQGDEVSILPFPASRPVGFRFPSGVSLPAQVGFATLPIVQSDGRVSTREA
jgi:uncharacterized protein (TIGR02594 family)